MQSGINTNLMVIAINENKVKVSLITFQLHVKVELTSTELKECVHYMHETLISCEICHTFEIEMVQWSPVKGCGLSYKQ